MIIIKKGVKNQAQMYKIIVNYTNYFKINCNGIFTRSDQDFSE